VKPLILELPQGIFKRRGGKYLVLLIKAVDRVKDVLVDIDYEYFFFFHTASLLNDFYYYNELFCGQAIIINLLYERLPDDTIFAMVYLSIFFISFAVAFSGALVPGPLPCVWQIATIISNPHFKKLLPAETFLNCYDSSEK